MAVCDARASRDLALMPFPNIDLEKSFLSLYGFARCEDICQVGNARKAK